MLATLTFVELKAASAHVPVSIIPVGSLQTSVLQRGNELLTDPVLLWRLAQGGSWSSDMASFVEVYLRSPETRLDFCASPESVGLTEQQMLGLHRGYRAVMA